MGEPHGEAAVIGRARSGTAGASVTVLHRAGGSVVTGAVVPVTGSGTATVV